MGRTICFARRRCCCHASRVSTLRRFFFRLSLGEGGQCLSSFFLYSHTAVFYAPYILYRRLSWDKGITDLGNINFALSFQSVFIFMIGLFATNKTDFHPWCLSAGAITATLFVFVFYFGYTKRAENPVGINAGVGGFGLNLLIAFSLEAYRRRFVASDEFDSNEDQRDLIFPYRPGWDIPHRARFGDRALTPNLLWKMMEGVEEPLTDPWFGILIFTLISFMCPILVPGLPEIAANTPTVNGLPWWASKMILTGIIPTFILLYVISRIPNNFPKVEAGKNADPDVLELTQEEMGHRSNYDSRNYLVAQRRREALERLGMLPCEIENLVETNHQPNTSAPPESAP